MPELSCHKRQGLFFLPSCHHGPTSALTNVHKGICMGVSMPKHKVGYLPRYRIETTGNNKKIFINHNLPTFLGGVVGTKGGVVVEPTVVTSGCLVVEPNVVTSGCLVVEIPADCELLSTARLATIIVSDFTPSQKVEKSCTTVALHIRNHNVIKRP